MEDDEDVMYSHSTKLFRFDSSANTWKERGVGEFKIMMHKDTKKARVLMRREKLLKVCANHAIVPGMELGKNDYCNRSLFWTSLADISDDEPKKEVFALRFKTPEDALDFKSYFEEIVKWVTYLSGDVMKKDEKPPLPHPNVAPVVAEQGSDRHQKENKVDSK